MSIPQVSLRRVLALDAASCALMGGLLAVLAEPVADLTALPGGLLLGAGVLLLPVAVFIALVARQGSRLGLRIVVAGNVLWIVTSLLVLAVVPANAMGIGLVLAQAAVVAALTGWEMRWLAPVPSRTS